MRLNVASDLHINKFSGATITEKESGMTNCIIQTDQDSTYITQRPSIDIFDSASVAALAARGRGIFYWELEGALYALVDGTLYKGDLGTSLSTSPTAGTKRVYFVEVNGVLVMSNPENGEAFTITTGDVVTEITDTDFPPKQNPVVSLADGMVSLDQFMFVMGTNGYIYNSAVGDAATWGALDFIKAERKPDNGVYIARHHDNVVAMNTSSIEMFYNARNASESPLNRREDLSYNIGCSTGESVYEAGDRLFWVGNDTKGALGVWTMQNFEIGKISTATIDSFLTQAIVKENYSALGSGLSAMGRSFYLLTLKTTPTDITPFITLCWDDKAKTWSEWETGINCLNDFPVVSGTNRLGTTERFFEGIMTNGDLFSINDNLIPQDTLLGVSWVVSGWAETGWVLETEDAGTNITMKSRLGMFDGGTNKYKYPLELRHVGDETTTSETLLIRWANEKSATSNFGSDKSIDMSLYKRLFGLGRFRRRNHEIETSSSEQVRIEALEGEFPPGDY